MSKKKTSLYIEASVWREIKKAAIDAGQTVGEFVTALFVSWRCRKNDCKPADQASCVKDRQG